MGTKKRRIRVDALIIRDGMCCTWCCRRMIDKPINYKRDCSLHMTLEHVRPVSLGGGHDLANLALSCFQCNNQRADSLVEFVPGWMLPLIP